MTDAVQIALITGAVSAFSATASFVSLYFMARLKQQGDAARDDRAEFKADRVEQKADRAVAAEKVEQVAVQAKEAATLVGEVKDTLDVTSKVTDKKLDTIHTLVNGAMSSQMKISAVALRRVADLSKHPDDIAAAELAESTYREHQGKQKDAERL